MSSFIHFPNGPPIDCYCEPSHVLGTRPGYNPDCIQADHTLSLHEEHVQFSTSCRRACVFALQEAEGQILPQS